MAVNLDLEYSYANLGLISIMKNSIRYFEPIDDPVFAAHQPFILYKVLLEHQPGAKLI